MAKGFFITGSGTNVGKTYISALLVKGLIELGRKVTYMKPVETGCSENGKDNLGADARYVLGFTECKTDAGLHSPYLFDPACSPHLAARMANREICIDNIISAYENLNKNTSADITIVEGAGGLLVPINDNNEYVADMIKALAIPAIVVTDPGLGTLNHTFMSLRTLERYGIPVIGVVINNARGIERDFIYEDNAATISRHVLPLPCLDVDYRNLSDKHLAGFCNEITSRV